MNLVKTVQDKKALKYSKKLPNNEIICKEILSILGNKNTEIVIDSEIKSSYYVFINNKIYIASNEENNNLYSRAILIAHECVHSVQSKIMQVLNFGFANIEIVFFVLALILKIFNVGSFANLTFTYISVCTISLMLRLILEIHAVLNSLPLARKYLEKNLSKEKTDVIIDASKKHIKRGMPIFLLSLCYKKFIRIGIILFVYLKF